MWLGLGLCCHGLFAPGLLAQDAGNGIRVELRAEHPEHVNGVNVRVYRVLATGPLEPVTQTPTFDEQGRCSVDLPKGSYRFEVLSGSGTGEIIALRTAVINVSKPATVDIKSAEMGEVKAIVEKQELPLDEVGIRSIGPKDEAAATTGFSRRVQLIVTPDQEYYCRFTANSADKLQTYVGWETIKPSQKYIINVNKKTYNAVSFKLRSESSAKSSAVASVAFPTSQVECPADEKHVLYTNRNFALIGYRVTLDGGAAIQFLPIGYKLSRSMVIPLYGKLKTSGYAEPVLTKEGDGEGNRLFWVVSLCDPAGHVADASKSDIHLQTLASLDKDPWTADSPYKGVDTAKLNDLRNRLRLKLTSDLSEFKEVAIVPEPFVTVKSQKFSLRVPGSWTFRGKNYLAKLERLNNAGRRATDRPGPAQVNINWRINFNDAWAVVGNKDGGDRGIWMSMPVSGLADDDLFKEPWAMCHEMMHNFGYPHGEEMNKAIEKSLYNFELYRWEAWDNRSLSP